MAFRAALILTMAISLSVGYADDAADEQIAKGFLHIEMPQRKIIAGRYQEIVLTIRETPQIGTIPANLHRRSIEEVNEILDDLAAHSCNTLISWYNTITDPQYNGLQCTRAAHAKGFKVYGIGSIAVIAGMPKAAKMLEEHPDAAMVDQHGKKLPRVCVRSQAYQKYITAIHNDPRLAQCELDGIIIDEPAYPDCWDAYREGRIGCYCRRCSEAYAEQYGGDIPRFELPAKDETNRLALQKALRFRRDTVTLWLSTVAAAVKKAAPNIHLRIVFNPNVVSSLYKGYISIGDACSVDLDAFYDEEAIDSVGIDPYWNAWNQPPKWYGEFVEKFIDLPHSKGKGSFFWMQAYFESPDQISRGLKPGEVTEAIRHSLGKGADGVFIWYYKGFRQEQYTWEDYFDEFAEAVLPYMKRPARTVKVSLEQGEVSQLKLAESEPGVYRLGLVADKPGDVVLRISNAAGISRTIKLVADEDKGGD